MFKKFRDIKNAPKGTKEQYAFLYAGIITLIIAGIWAVSVPSKFAPLTSPTTDPEITKEASNFARVYADLRKQLSASVGLFGGDIGDTAVSDTDNSTSNPTQPTAQSATGTIDIDAMFGAATSTRTASPTPAAPPTRTVLIATSSRATSTSQTN